jgi:plastocyanin
LFGAGATYSKTFDAPGEYTYYCIPHPVMIGKVIVTG